ncbi:hypothetical protein FB451DRAFT_1174540 [Mycena latifolia]|nr:hypothetical protein FB451DRAFT_1174540 [Mycena latifolia]
MSVHSWWKAEILAEVCSWHLPGIYLGPGSETAGLYLRIPADTKCVTSKSKISANWISVWPFVCMSKRHAISRSGATLAQPTSRGCSALQVEVRAVRRAPTLLHETMNQMCAGSPGLEHVATGGNQRRHAHHGKVGMWWLESYERAILKKLWGSHAGGLSGSKRVRARPRGSERPKIITRRHAAVHCERMIEAANGMQTVPMTARVLRETRGKTRGVREEEPEERNTEELIRRGRRWRSLGRWILFGVITRQDVAREAEEDDGGGRKRKRTMAKYLHCSIHITSLARCCQGVVSTTPSSPVFSHRTTVTDADEPSYFDSATANEDATDYGVSIPVATCPKHTACANAATKGALTLRDQHIDNFKKENFNIKLRIQFLKERLAQLAPDQIDAASKQNISFNMEVQQRSMELKKLKKLVLELERKLDRLQHVGVGTDRAGSRDLQREFEEKLEECNSELRELCRRTTGDLADALLAELEDELNNMRSLLEDNMDKLKAARLAALETANAELVARAEEETKQLRLENEDLQQQLQRAEAQERSESRAIILEEREEREEREAEDELEMKNAEIDDLVAEHERFVAVIEEELRNCVMCSERESESKDLRLNISELEANTDDLHSKFEAAPAYLEEETEAQDAEIESIQQTIDKLGECSRTRTTATTCATRRPPSATVSRPSPLRSKTCVLLPISSLFPTFLKAELEITQLYEACSDEIQAAAAKEHAGALRAEHRILNTNESALRRVLADLACTQALLATRDPDLTAVQATFQALEGESHCVREMRSRPPQAQFECVQAELVE